MSIFELAVEFVLSNEGGFIDNPHDSGGATNGGISLRFLREIPEIRLRKYGIFELPSVEVIKELTRDQIINIYRGEFWNVGFFEKIVEQRICNYIFDMCISHGFKQAIILVQRAGWAAIHHYNYVEDDGIMGINTLTVINLWSNGNLLLYSFISSLCSERAGYCRLLVAIDALNKEFLDGWLRRCYRI